MPSLRRGLIEKGDLYSHVVGICSRKKVVKTPQNTPLLVSKNTSPTNPQCPLPLAVPSILSYMLVVGYGACLISINPPIRRVDSSYISGTSTLTFQVITYNIPTFLPIFLIKSTNMSNPFMIAAQALVSTPSSTSLAFRPGPKAKPLAARQSLHALQLVRHDHITTATTDGLLAQFKANIPAKLDSDSDNNLDIRRRSYTREQKLAAIGYTATKQV
jgi:hypothetical protein